MTLNHVTINTMNQLTQPDRPETVFKRAYARTAYAFDGANFWVEDNWRQVIGALSAVLLITTVVASVSNQNAIDEDGKAVRQAAVSDGIKVESIASGIRDGKVLANIAIGDCRIVDSTLNIRYVDGVLQVDDYTVPTTIMTTNGTTSSQAIHISNASDLQKIAPLSAVCE